MALAKVRPQPLAFPLPRSSLTAQAGGYHKRKGAPIGRRTTPRADDEAAMPLLLGLRRIATPFVPRGISSSMIEVVIKQTVPLPKMHKRGKSLRQVVVLILVIIKDQHGDRAGIKG